jgi:DNA-binding IclR family transcriptional regulator
MSKTLLSRLAMFETLDACGPLSITELAKRSGLDVTVVSRTVSACEPDGWLMRVGGRIALGPRSTLLGHSGPTATVIAAAAPLVHAVAGVTGLLTQAFGLVGNQSVLIAEAPGRGRSAPVGLALKAPLYATAGGRAIAVQLAPAQLTSLLPEEPYPDASDLVAAMTGTTAESMFSAFRSGPAMPAQSGPVTLARTREELEAQLDAVRRDAVSVDAGSLDPAIHCVAVPWPQADLPAALVCLGTAPALAASQGLIRRVLQVAARYGAEPRDVIAAAVDDGVLDA